eukprot:7212187-Heterocapsa_arctica.AAC.1
MPAKWWMNRKPRVALYCKKLVATCAAARARAGKAAKAARRPAAALSPPGATPVGAGPCGGPAG